MRTLGLVDTLGSFKASSGLARWTLLFVSLFAAGLTACEPRQAPTPDVERLSPSPPPNEDVGPPEPTDRRVLITFDDLPIAMRDDYRDDEERRQTVARLVEVLREHEVPVVGFFNMRDHDDDPVLAQTWLKHEQLIAGNHSWSHPNARKEEIDDFLDDIRKGHRALAELVPEQKSIPFRFPYLNRGFDEQKRERIFETLAELESPLVPVTIDTSDWLHARGYLDAVHEEDGPSAERWKQNWLWNIQESTMVAEFWANELFGRQPPQILLLHANRLNADHLPEALAWFRERGYRFVGLEETLADPAYTEVDTSLSPIGVSHWLRLRRSRVIGEAEPVEEDGELR